MRLPFLDDPMRHHLGAPTEFRFALLRAAVLAALLLGAVIAAAAPRSPGAHAIQGSHATHS